MDEYLIFNHRGGSTEAFSLEEAFEIAIEATQCSADIVMISQANQAFSKPEYAAFGGQIYRLEPVETPENQQN